MRGFGGRMQPLGMPLPIVIQMEIDTEIMWCEALDGRRYEGNEGPDEFLRRREIVGRIVTRNTWECRHLSPRAR